MNLLKSLTSLAASFGKNLLAMLIGVVVALGLLEGSARIFASVLGVSPYMQYDATLGWKALPGATKRHKNPGLNFDVTYEINAHGHRGKSYPHQKPPGIYRIVILGDSNGFGWGIAEGEHFAARLDAAMPGVEVINLSLSGYGTDQEYLRLTTEGLALEPDLVILQLTENDFDEIQYSFYNQKPKPQFVLKFDRTLELTNVPVRSVGPKADEFYRNSLPLPFREWLGWHSYAYNWLNEKYYGVKRRYAPVGGVTRERFSPESIDLFNSLLEQITRTLDEHDVRVLVVHASKEISANNLFRAESPEVVDVWPVFAEYARTHSGPPMIPDGVHWNAEGHRIVTDTVLERLRALGEI